jgi:putative lipoprotein
MMRKTFLPAIALALATAGCATAPGSEPVTSAGVGLEAGQLSGTIYYRERSALPADVTIRVQIADVARMDAPSRTIAETSFRTEGRQVPIPFILRYAADRPSGHAEYAVSARIEDASGKLLFITDTRNAMIPGGHMALWLVSAAR